MHANNVSSMFSCWHRKNVVKRNVLFIELLRKRIPVLSSLSSSEMSTLQSLFAVYDPGTNAHAQRVVFLAEAVARELCFAEEEIFLVCLAALLHDIGKAGIPEAILNKPGSLDECEWEIMRRHVEIGEQMLLQVGGVFARVASVVLTHHERWDGCGYPDGLSGEEIPLAARIIAVVDSYDAIVQRRVYHAPQPDAEACAELQRCAGSQFDPHIVAIFLSLLLKSRGRRERSKRIPASGGAELAGAMYAVPSLQSGECAPASA
jgi:putative nucleotidyltransferase with HDIG domain